MKIENDSRKLSLLVALTAGLGLMAAGRGTAQTFRTLYNFTATSGSNSTNIDGAYPQVGLMLWGDTLYGAALRGGSSGNGVVFDVKTNGAGFTTLYSFSARTSSTNSDGANPYGLSLSGGTLYGAALRGGDSGNGTVFAVSTNGVGFTNLHDFTATSGSNSTNSDGVNPHAGLILAGNTLYGTALRGGGSGNGTVFAVSTNGTGFTTLHSFTAFNNNTNSDGANPYSGLIISGNTLYGTANAGGGSGNGTVFGVHTDGTGFTNLHSFTALNNSTNRDGANPQAGLILLGNTLYGTTAFGGSSGNGTVFGVHTDGTGFTNLHSFTALNNSTNRDGANPQAGLIFWGNTLYGTTAFGGSSGNGTVFGVDTDGTGFTTLHSFSAFPTIFGAPNTNSDGAYPVADLILWSNTLYGTASQGGASGYGTVFSLVLQPQLNIILSGANVILTWPTNATGLILQSATNLVAPTLWSQVFPGPVVVNGRNTVTNPVSGTRKFYRLSQ